MPLAAGRRLGPYEIVAPLGAGGMGEVYRARDPRLGRDVAIKVLPAAVSADPDRLRRFELEARAVAALSHPNLVVVHDVGVGEPAFIVMELVGGSSLRERLGRGPLTPAVVARIGAQVARGIAAAHARGIVHRDLKPENVVLDAAGTAKVLDFGLARLAEADGAALADAPTAVEATAGGRVLGTPGYMAPEQVRGEAAGPPADLFALGAMLFEMLTGTRTFPGGSAVDTLHGILHHEPKWDLLPPAAAGFEPLLRRCLEKTAAARFQSAADLAWELERGETATASAAPLRSRRALPAAAVVVAASALVGFAAFQLGARRVPIDQGGGLSAVATLTPFTVDPGRELDGVFLADNETIAYAADRSGNLEIYLQQPGGGAAINLTQHPADDVQPAVSPDGRQIAFASSRESVRSIYYPSLGAPLAGGDVWAMPVLGGPARKIAEDGNYPAWSPDGTAIYFVRPTWQRPEIRKVAATGGESVAIPLSFPSGESPILFENPAPSPDDRWLLFTGQTGVYIAPIAGGEAALIGSGQGAIWDPSGRVIWYCTSGAGKNRALLRLAFDPATGRAAGGPQTILLGTERLRQPAIAASGRRLIVTTTDRSSNLERVGIDPVRGAPVGEPRSWTRGANAIFFSTVSPDGRSVVFQNSTGAFEHLWRVDDGGEPYLLTRDAEWEESYPRWSPDGRSIAFTRRPRGALRLPGVAALWAMNADGSAPRRLVEKGGNMAWLPDSSALVYIHRKKLFRLDLADGRSTPIPIEGVTPMPIFTVTPDGAAIVLQSSDTGGVDLYLVPIDGGKARLLTGGPREEVHPSLAADGRWLYYQIEHHNLWRIPGPAQGWRSAPPQKVTHFPETGLFLEEPMVVPSGDALLYLRVNTESDLWTVELEDAAGPTAKAETGSSP